MGYERFHIEAKPAPHLYPVPSRFDVSARKLRLAAMLVHEAFEYRFKRDVVLSRPCIYGVFSGRLGGFKPIKEKCVGCMRCVQEYPHIMTVRPSDEYKSLGDSHWTPDAVFTVLYESSTGKIPVKGMGYKGAFAGEGFDGIWTDMSEIVRPTRDGVYGREYISTTVDIGRKPFFLSLDHPGAEQVVKTVEASVPVIFDQLPEPTVTDEVSDALDKAASKLNTFHISRPSKTRRHGKGWIPLVEESDLPGSSSILQESRIIEYDHDRSDMYNELRTAYPSAVISARIALKEGCEEAVSKLVRDGVDVLHFYADLHGKDYSTRPRHVSDAVKQVHGFLVKEGLRDQVTIIASGGITLAEHVPKAIICGADLVGIDTTLLVALQAEFQGETRDRENCALRVRSMDPAWGTQRVVNLVASWHDQLIEILSAMGMRDVRRLRGEIGRSMTDAELREQAFGEIAWAT